MKKILFFLLTNISLFSIKYIPYQGILKELETEHFKIIFSEKDIKIAILVSQYAEDIHKKLSTFFNNRFITKTVILLTDHTDLPNGLAYNYVRNTIVVYLTHSDLEQSLGTFENPLYSLLLHEYSHIMHIGNIDKAALFWRIFYGESLFPNSLIFIFLIEGIAVFCESKFSGGGRLSSNYNMAIMKEAIINNKVLSFDRLIFPVVDWPYGDAVYHYGARFVLYLYNFYGEEKLIEYIDSIGSDFIPLMCVLKFKKIYGKSLRELWKEWINYEKSNFLNNSKESDSKNISIINLNGDILSISKNNDKFYISINSYEYDNAIYEYDKNKNKLKKIIKVYSKNIKYYDNKLFFTKFNNYRDGFLYSDLYYYDFNKKISKRLTFNKRISYFDLENNKLVFVTHSSKGSLLFLSDFIDNKIKNIRNIELQQNIYFIGKIDLNENGKKLIFSARMIDNSKELFIYDLENNLIKRLEISGLNPLWLLDNEIIFISNEMDKIFKYNLIENNSYEIYSSDSCIMSIFLNNDKIYYVEYRNNGTEFFLLNNAIGKKSFLKNGMYMDYSIESTVDYNNMGYGQKEQFKIRNYSPLSYLKPSVWFYLPALLDSKFYITNTISLPFIAPQYSILNFTPENRFSYTISITYDYIKRYPNNYINLSLRFPYFIISYYWSNWLGGYKIWYKNNWYSSKVFPVNLANNLSFNFPISLFEYGNIEITADINHYFINNKNRLTFYEVFTYYYINSSARSSRWDSGFLFSLNFLLSPDKILDNFVSYLLNFYLLFRIPIKNSFFYFDFHSGIDFLKNNTFNVDSNIVNIMGIDSSINSLYIDTKAFSSILNTFNQDIRGFLFISIDTGFDITIYKRTHYLHFLTLCFNELYFKIYNEFVYILNNEKMNNFLFDFVFQLNLDVSLIYGYLPISFIIGASIGYLIGDYKPSWGIFFYFSSNLNIEINSKRNFHFSSN